MLAVVGRPNVGKSTLVNRIIGRREAVVQDVPGVTRDRVSYDANWNGRAFTVVDTGGWDPDARGLAEAIRAQAEIAVSVADAVMFVVDATIGITDTDEAVVKILRRAGKPVVLAANKVDDQRAEAEAASLWNLGLGEPYAVSALHGRGSGDLLDAILEALPETPSMDDARGRPAPGRDRRQAERRQVLAAEQARPRGARRRRRRRRYDGRPGRRAGTRSAAGPGGSSTPPASASGSRRRRATSTTPRCAPAPRSSAPRSCVMVVDASQPLTEQDQRIITSVAETGRALVIAFNKWDLVDEERRYYLERGDRARPRPGPVGAAGEHHRPHRLAHRPARARAGRGAGGLGDPDLHRAAQLVPRPARRRAPAPGAQRQAGEDPVRDPGHDLASDVRAVHLRAARGGVRAVHRASAA